MMIRAKGGLNVCFGLVLLFISFNSFSQNSFSAGLSGGINGSQVSGDNLGGFNKPGINAGAFCNFPLNEKTRLQFEILFTQKGSQKNARPKENDFISYKLNLNYIEVPVLALIKLPFLEELTVEVGPSFGALLSYSEEDQNGTVPITRDFDKTEISLNIGVDYKAQENLSFNLRFNNSVLPIRDHVSGQTFRWNLGQYNSVISLMVRYSI